MNLEIYIHSVKDNRISKNWQNVIMAIIIAHDPYFKYSKISFDRYRAEIKIIKNKSIGKSIIDKLYLNDFDFYIINFLLDKIHFFYFLSDSKLLFKSKLSFSSDNLSNIYSKYAFLLLVSDLFVNKIKESIYFIDRKKILENHDFKQHFQQSHIGELLESINTKYEWIIDEYLMQYEEDFSIPIDTSKSFNAFCKQISTLSLIGKDEIFNFALDHYNIDSTFDGKKLEQLSQYLLINHRWNQISYFYTLILITDYENILLLDENLKILNYQNLDYFEQERERGFENDSIIWFDFWEFVEDIKNKLYENLDFEDFPGAEIIHFNIDNKLFNIELNDVWKKKIVSFDKVFRYEVHHCNSINFSNEIGFNNNNCLIKYREVLKPYIHKYK